MLCLVAFTFSFCREQTGMKEPEKTDFQEQRRQMVEQQLQRRDITDPLVLKAMRRTPRHRFVPAEYRNQSYVDGPLPIGCQQTISQPYIVAIMTQLATIDSTSRVLEIGTGSGYQAAVLAEIADSVFSIEIVDELCHRADSTLSHLGYQNVEVKCGDGYRGWVEHAPYDAILVTAAPDHVPQPLVDQLKIGGKLIIPVGQHHQDLLQITKSESGAIQKSVIPVRFVPMTGEALE